MSLTTMDHLLTYARKSYWNTTNELADPRVSDWFLMNSLTKILLINAVYIYSVKALGPKLMEKRKPFNIDKLMIAYNFIQMLINAYIFYTVGKVVFTTFNFYCNPIDYSNNPDAITLLNEIYLYFLTKLLDLLDTIFFVLRKKHQQVSFLHVYHHSSMILIMWLLTKHYGGGHTVFAPFLNSVVHVCMYGYYLCSIIDKDLRNNLSVKRRITELQLVQFVIGFTVNGLSLTSKDCTVPKILICISLTQCTFLMFLFGSFYIKSYVRKKKNVQMPNFGCLTVTNMDIKLDYSREPKKVL